MTSAEPPDSTESGAELATEQAVAQAFIEAMATFPTGVTVVTTTDSARRPWGFTASSFCSLSKRPPLVLVCLAKSAQCHPVFSSAESWLIHIAGNNHQSLATKFATRHADKFAGGEFHLGAGAPRLPDAAATVECTRYAVHDGGDHSILIGRVRAAEISGRAPVVYCRRQFHAIWDDSAR